MGHKPSSGFCDLGFAKLDIDRKQRRGFPEAVYCQGKTREHLKEICHKILAHKQELLLTRLDRATYAYLKRSFPKLLYRPLARIAHMPRRNKRLSQGFVAIISAGTADIPVAEEAAVTLEVMGNRVEKFYDIGVAGVHRLMHNIEAIRKAKVVIVVAGMEGALASITSGLVGVAVVAVPTSCGYGASFAGLAALLTMINSCSPGVAVVNIDNGFGAGYLAALINT